MKRSWWLVALALVSWLLVGCLGGTSPGPEIEPLSATVGRYEVRAAGAEFVHDDECHHTQVEVVASEDRTSEVPRTRLRGAGVSVFVVRTSCADGVTFAGAAWVPLRADDFVVAGDASRARVRATVLVRDDERGLTVPVELDLVWTADGESWSWHDRTAHDGGTTKSRYRSDGVWREAWVEGMVSVGLPGFVPVLPARGWLGRSFGGSVIVAPGPPDRAPAEILYFDVDPPRTYEGGVAMLSWLVSGAEPLELAIDQGVGDVSGMTWVTVRPAETTTYTLTARNRWGRDSAQVTVVVDAPPLADGFEPNDTPKRAAAIELDFLASGLTMTPGDLDWFTFELYEPTIVRGEARPADRWLNPIVGLGRQDRPEDAIDWLQVNDGHVEGYLHTGRYFLVVSNYPDYELAGDHDGMGGYELEVTAAPPLPSDRFEPNDTRGAAPSIELPFSEAELTITAFDVDWFAFELDGPAVVAVEAGATVWLAPLLALVDGTGDVLALGHRRVHAVLPAGTNYLAVTGSTDGGLAGDHQETGSYRLAIAMLPPDEFEPNDEPGAAATLTLPWPGSELSLTPGDVDWFTFTLEDEADIVVRVDGQWFDQHLYLRIGLFDAALDLLATDASWLSATLPAGTYRFAITAEEDAGFEGQHDLIGAYELYVDHRPGPLPDALEPNDTCGAAAEITCPAYLDGLTLTRGDVDWFRFEVVAPGTVDAYVWSADGRMEPLAGLWDAEGTELGRGDHGVRVEVPAGWYHLAVSTRPDDDFRGDHLVAAAYVLHLGCEPEE